jgi:hypothetical protein
MPPPGNQWRPDSQMVYERLDTDARLQNGFALPG